MCKKLATVIAVTIVLMCWTSASAGADPGSAPPGSIGLRLVDVSGSEDPRARLSIVDRLDAGETIRRRIEVSNGTASAARIVLYAGAAVDDGSFKSAPGHTSNELSDWTSVLPGAPNVPAGARVTATVKISIPSDALPGEHYGVVWAEMRSAADAGVTQVSRVGVRLSISVGLGGSPPASFTIDSLRAARSPDGRPVVLASVHNNGGRALEVDGSLHLRSGPAGLTAGPFAAAPGITLAVGATEPIVVVLDGRLPAGPWDARISLRSGSLERSARATITFPTSSASSSSTDGRARWVATLGLVAMLAIAVEVARSKRRALQVALA